MRCEVHGFRGLIYFGFTFTWRVLWGDKLGTFTQYGFGEGFSAVCVCGPQRAGEASVKCFSLGDRVRVGPPMLAIYCT